MGWIFKQKLSRRMTKKGHSSSGTMGWLKRWRWYWEGGLVMGGPGTLWLVLLDTGTEALDTALILDYRGKKCLDELSPNLLKLLQSLPRQGFGGKRHTIVTTVNSVLSNLPHPPNLPGLRTRSAHSALATFAGPWTRASGAQQGCAL